MGKPGQKAVNIYHKIGKKDAKGSIIGTVTGGPRTEKIGSPFKQGEEHEKMTATDSLAVKQAIKSNISYDSDEFKKGASNPNNYSHHHNLFVYSDASRNAAGIGSGGSVKGGDTAYSSWDNYRTNKKTARQNLSDLTEKHGKDAVQGIKDEVVQGPKEAPENTGPDTSLLKPAEGKKDQLYMEKQGGSPFKQGSDHVDPPNQGIDPPTSISNTKFKIPSGIRKWSKDPNYTVEGLQQGGTEYTDDRTGHVALKRDVAQANWDAAIEANDPKAAKKWG